MKKTFKTFEQFLDGIENAVTVGDKIKVVNNDFLEGEIEEPGCTVEEVVTPTVIVVSLGSDPSIKCNAQWVNDRWELTSDVIED